MVSAYFGTALDANIRTTNVCARSIRDHDIKVHATATGILADETLIIRFLDSTLQSNPLSYIFTSAAQESFKPQQSA